MNKRLKKKMNYINGVNLRKLNLSNGDYILLEYEKYTLRSSELQQIHSCLKATLNDNAKVIVLPNSIIPKTVTKLEIERMIEALTKTLD